MISKEERNRNSMVLRKKNILKLLKPCDAFMFQDCEEVEYFFVKRVMVQDERIEGKYFGSFGMMDRIMSYDEIISRNARVAYFQEIVAAQ